MATFSTALLAGGASKRMGRDKALLTLPGASELLWQRQWRVLEDLEPQEMFWSGPPRPALPDRARIVRDVVENAGPLAGISACLDAMRGDLLVVLAIDLPEMNTPFLRGLCERCIEGRGAVIRHGDFFEPLAAVYPKTLHALASRHLAQGRFSLQDFIRQALQQDALAVIPLDQADGALFRNLNAPTDLGPEG